MSHAHIAAGAMLKMGKYPLASYPDLAVPPVLEAIRASGFERGDIDHVYCGHSFGGMLAGQRIGKEIGLAHIPVMNVENACSGGASALHEAVLAVREERSDVALVIGVEKLTQFGGGTLPLDAEDPEVQEGMVMPALYAMRAQRYMLERDATLQDLAAVSVKARTHGARNPFAQMSKPITIDEVLQSRPIATPLTLLQCCPTSDGAAAVIVVSDRARRKTQSKTVKITASLLHSGSVTAGFRDMTRPEITYKSAAEAYEQAGFGPGDLQCVELHDAFSVAELVYYEALGLCAPGEAVSFLRSGASAFGGRTVVNPSGGLLSKGHPVGASGVAQAVEIYWQLTGVAEGRQVERARRALSHVTGGGISGLDHGACAVHLYEV